MTIGTWRPDPDRPRRSREGLPGAMPYTAFQAMIDPFAPRGMLNYHRGIHLTGLVDEAIGSYVDLGAEIAQVSSPTTRPPPGIATPPTWRGLPELRA